MDILLSPPLVFLFFTGIGFGIYALGNKMAPRFDRGDAKISAYACGEDITNQRAPFSYEDFFRIALFYTVMEVGALVIATIPQGTDALWALIFLFVISIGVATLTFRYD